MMYRVIVTGGLGSGKSTLVDLLRDKGALTVDLDEVNRGLLQTNERYVGELVERFGEGILDENGFIVPAQLAGRAFVDEETTRELNAISFPYIIDAASDYLVGVHCAPRTRAKVTVLEVPLLTEVPELAELADEVIAVSAPSELRLRRAIERGMDPLDALQRLQRQASDAERAALATTICDNSGSYEDLAAWADAWWDEHVPTSS